METPKPQKRGPERGSRESPGNSRELTEAVCPRRSRDSRFVDSIFKSPSSSSPPLLSLWARRAPTKRLEEREIEFDTAEANQGDSCVFVQWSTKQKRSNNAANRKHYTQGVGQKTSSYAEKTILLSLSDYYCIIGYIGRLFSLSCVNVVRTTYSDLYHTSAVEIWVRLHRAAADDGAVRSRRRRGRDKGHMQKLSENVLYIVHMYEECNPIYARAQQKSGGCFCCWGLACCVNLLACAVCVPRRTSDHCVCTSLSLRSPAAGR